MNLGRCGVNPCGVRPTGQRIGRCAGRLGCGWVIVRPHAATHNTSFPHCQQVANILLSIAHLSAHKSSTPYNTVWCTPAAS